MFNKERETTTIKEEIEATLNYNHYNQKLNGVRFDSSTQLQTVSAKNQSKSPALLRFFTERKSTKEYKRILLTKKIAITGMMFALVLLFSWIAHLSGIFTFLKIDVSLVFILATLMVAGYQYALTLIILKFAIVPAFTGGAGYSHVGILGHVILLITFLIATTVYYLLANFHLVLSRKIKISDSNRRIVHVPLKWQVTYIIAALALTTVAISTLNTFLFNPLYFSLFGMLQGPATYSNMANLYALQGFSTFFFGIPEYINGSYALYTAFNTIQFSIVGVVTVGFIIFYSKSYKYFGLDQSIYLTKEVVKKPKQLPLAVLSKKTDPVSNSFDWSF
ncbi:hypothetical protein CJJ23_02200 [Mycoplasmopsis agassizii]|uniref:Uncharacterized protein n=1 Tax=Mycoplasmopsis agassizii TaxID=33922 RepID=A0A269TKG9_9BACT|nr:hypothetical protein [Mycoplasmopsis agassizii]PAK21438.1 hypothetical protein CJJ23_02200 [Mycoplasmopsis agassizii]